MVSKKKVLFTSHTANFQKFNRPFMRWFSEQGYEVHYASAGEERVLDADEAFVVPFKRSPFSLSNIKAIFQLKKIIDVEHYDIIHTHTPMGSVVTRLAAISARKNGTRVIYTAHGFHFFKGAPYLNWVIYYPIEKFMASFADTIITINKEDYGRASKKFKTEIEYVPGVGLHFSDKEMNSLGSKDVIRESLGFNKNDFLIIYPAELNRNKDQLTLLKVMKEVLRSHANTHLILAGQDSLNGLYQRTAQKMGIESNVHFLGYRNDIPDLIRASDLSVSASHREGLPVNIMEAMYFGLPIVATSCRGNRDLVQEGVNGYLVPTSGVEHFVLAINKLIIDDELRYSLGKNSLKEGKKFVFKNILRLYRRIYVR